MNVKIKDKKVYIDIKDQALQSIEWWKEQGNTRTPTPASFTLFSTDDSTPTLSENESGTFHSIVQKVLYIYKRAMPNIEPAICALGFPVPTLWMTSS